MVCVGFTRCCSMFAADVTSFVSSLDRGLDALDATAPVGQTMDVATEQFSAVQKEIDSFSEADLQQQEALISGESIASIKKEIDGESQSHSDHQVLLSRDLGVIAAQEFGGVMPVSCKVSAADADFRLRYVCLEHAALEARYCKSYALLCCGFSYTQHLHRGAVFTPEILARYRKLGQELAKVCDCSAVLAGDNFAL